MFNISIICDSFINLRMTLLHSNWLDYIFQVRVNLDDFIWIEVSSDDSLTFPIFIDWMIFIDSFFFLIFLKLLQT